METSPVVGVSFLLFLVLLVLAPIAISQSSLRLKATLQILAGMAVGIAAGTALGALSRNGELAGNLAVVRMFCGGIWVSVRRIRRARSARSARKTGAQQRLGSKSNCLI